MALPPENRRSTWSAISSRFGFKSDTQSPAPAARRVSEPTRLDAAGTDKPCSALPPSQALASIGRATAPERGRRADNEAVWDAMRKRGLVLSGQGGAPVAQPHDAQRAHVERTRQAAGQYSDASRMQEKPVDLHNVPFRSNGQHSYLNRMQTPNKQVAAARPPQNAQQPIRSSRVPPTEALAVPATSQHSLRSHRLDGSRSGSSVALRSSRPTLRRTACVSRRGSKRALTISRRGSRPARPSRNWQEAIEDGDDLWAALEKEMGVSFSQDTLERPALKRVPSRKPTIKRVSRAMSVSRNARQVLKSAAQERQHFYDNPLYMSQRDPEMARRVSLARPPSLARQTSLARNASIASTYIPALDLLDVWAESEDDDESEEMQQAVWRPTPQQLTQRQLILRASPSGRPACQDLDACASACTAFLP